PGHDGPAGRAAGDEHPAAGVAADDVAGPGDRPADRVAGRPVLDRDPGPAVAQVVPLARRRGGVDRLDLHRAEHPVVDRQLVDVPGPVLAAVRVVRSDDQVVGGQPGRGRPGDTLDELAVDVEVGGVVRVEHDGDVGPGVEREVAAERVVVL